MIISSCDINNISAVSIRNNKTKTKINFTSLRDEVDFNFRKDIALKYMKIFKSGDKCILRKINRLNPAQLKMLQEALRSIEENKDTLNPYCVFSRKLQCDAGYEDVAQKTIKTKEGSKIQLEISFNEDKIPRISRTEYFENKIISWTKNTNKLVIVEKKFNEDKGIYEFEHQFEILNNENNEPFKIIHSKRNEKLPEFIEMSEYNLADYDENFDIIDAIKEETIQGGKKLSSIKFENNSFLITQELTQNDTKTKRNYFKTFDEDGNIIKTEYSYQIFDYLGCEIMDINRIFEINQDKTTTTIIGNKTYKTKFDDFQKVISITDENSRTINLDIKKYHIILDEEKIYEFLKKTPADLLIQLANCDVREFWSSYLANNSFVQSCANGRGFKIQLGQFDEETFAHEIGHIVDYSSFDRLLENQEIKEMYIAEWEIFKENNPQVEEKDMKYFSLSSQARGINILNRPAKDDGGLRELIAEVNMLTKTYGLDGSSATRANALVKYFPNTIALIAKNLEASTLI